MSRKIEVPRELLESMVDAFEYECRDEWAEPLRVLLAAPESPRQEPVAYSYKEYVWATGLGAYVWRDKLETDRPSTEDSEIKDLFPLYTSPTAPLSPDHSGGAGEVVLPESTDWIRSAARKWFYESFDDELLEKMQAAKLIAQAEGFSISVMAELELAMEEAYRDKFKELNQ